MKLKLSRAKRNIEPEAPYISKKLRSKIPRRIRSQISPILKNRGVSTLSVDSSSCSYFGDEVSCDSSRVSLQSNLKKNGKREFGEIENAPFRRITRSYYKQTESERRENEVDASESSCVESYNSGAVFGERVKRSDNDKEIDVSEISCVDQVSGTGNLKFSSESNRNDVVSKFESTEISDFVVDQRPNNNNNNNNNKSFGDEDSDLACTEQFSYDDVSVNSFDFSDYTPSLFFDSGSQFSEKSTDDSTPSLTHSLLLEFRQQFSRSTAPQDTRIDKQFHDPSTLVRFENEEDEESYTRLRERERRKVFLHDYAEEYLSATDYGDLVLDQRSQMVHWIIEQCAAKGFQQETMFLGISLLDRFLSKGFFTNKKNLQIVGIACLALATRIEENQPYNSVRQRNFYIGSNTYSRCEVVAMEWLVQEVLNFQCFLPTIYSFLWFYLKAARADAEVEKKTKYLAVLALSDHEQLCYWPSTVAAGLVILASLESNQDTTYHRVIEIHVRTKDNDLPECIKSLEWLLQYVS